MPSEEGARIGLGTPSRTTAGRPRLRRLPFVYRPPIDGIRAIAALLVVVFHAGAPFSDHGYIGVDIFFVLSGFLITSILVREMFAEHRVDILAFYARRARRLLPMSLTVLIVTAIVFRLVATPLEVAEARGGFIASALYVANWYFLAQSQDYFADDNAPSPVLHYWSLSAEEQFYIVWPLLMLVLVLATRRYGVALRWVVAALAVSGLLYSGIVAQSSPMLSYFGTVARAYQLFAGAFVALMVFRWDGGQGPVRDPRGNAHGAVWSAAGLALLFVTASPLLGSLGPFGRGALAVLGVVVLLFGLELTPSSRVSRMLALPPMRTLGNLSYSIYLWHWPVVVLGDRVGMVPTAWLPRVAVVVAASVGLAALGMRLVEAPGRGIGLATLRRRRRVAAAGPVAALVVSLALMMILPVTGRVAALLEATGETPDAAVRSTVVDHFGSSDPGAVTILIVGDSHARTWLTAFARHAEEHGWRVVGVRRNRCAWVEVDRTESARGEVAVRDYCSGMRGKALEVAAQERPDLTLLITRSLFGGESALVTTEGTVVRPDDPEWITQVRTGTQEFLAALATSSRKVAILEPVPETRVSMNECLSTGAQPSSCDLPALDPAGAPEAEDYWRSLSTGGQVTDLDLDELVCPGGTCPAEVDGMITHKDYHHLTDDFAASLVERIVADLRQRGMLPPDS